jgi:hypothetical protein
LKVCQEALQPGHRLGVKVVGGLQAQTHKHDATAGHVAHAHACKLGAADHHQPNAHLIKQQDVWGGQQQACEGDAPPLATRQDLDQRVTRRAPV